MIRSKLKIYSIGIVVDDKKLDSQDIVVYPVETLPLEDNDLGYKEQLKTNKPDSFNKQVSSTVDRENTITATWLPIYNSNRVTAPDMIKNETVLLLKYEDTDKFYWVDILNELGIRRRETALFLFGNDGNYGEDLNLDNSYWFKVSSHGKKLHLHTSDNDGELCTYDITIDTKNGYFELIDGRGNYIKLDSSIDSLLANINKDIKIVNGRNITINNGKDINVDSKGTTTMKSGGPTNITNGVTHLNLTGGSVYLGSDAEDITKIISDLIGVLLNLTVTHAGLHPISGATSGALSGVKSRIDSLL